MSSHANLIHAKPHGPTAHIRIRLARWWSFAFSTSSPTRQLTSQHTGVEQNVDIRTRHCTYAPIARRQYCTHWMVLGRREASPQLRKITKPSPDPLADSPFRSSTARATCSVASPAPSPSSSSTARRSSLCDVRLSTSRASSSARSVRTHHTRRTRASDAKSRMQKVQLGDVDTHEDGVETMHLLCSALLCSLAQRSWELTLHSNN
jgi:hypothetical protein